MNRATDPKYTVTGTHLGESLKAVKFKVDSISGSDLESPKTEWFPFSQVSKIHKGPNEGEDYLVVSEWILNQKGML